MLKTTPIKICDILKYHRFRQNLMYIERCTNINFSGIISDTKWISEPYRIFKSGVKPYARKMRLYENKKGKSIG